MRRKHLISLAIAVGVPLLAAAVGLLYLNFADLSGWRGTVERLASDAIGRDLRIAGEFAPEIGFKTRVVASDVTLANPDGWPEPHMVSVDHLEGELDLLSLLSGPLTINDIVADGVTVLLEADDEGRATWQFPTDDEPSTADTGPVDIVIGHAKLTDVGLVLSAPSMPAPLELSNADLELTSDDAGMVDLELAGDLNGAAFELEGRLGTLGSLFVAGAVEHDLKGRFGDTHLALRGAIGDLASLGDADIVVELGGPDLAVVGDRFGISELPAAPFRIEVNASPTPQGSALAANGELGEITATIEGTVDSLASFADLDVDVAASGPSIAEVGALTGVSGLPANEFSVSGRVHWQGFPVSFIGFDAIVGNNVLTLDGVLGAPPEMLDTDFRIAASGPNCGELAALAGLALPPKEFEIDGHLVRIDGGILIEKVAARIGRTSLDVDGVVGDPPAFAGTEITFSASGPDITPYAGLLGIKLPAESFEVRGRLTPDGDDIVLNDVEARLGSNNATVGGRIATTTGFVGTDLRLTANGPGLSWLEPIVGLENLPAGVYRVDGGFRVVAKGYRLNEIEAAVGTLSLAIDGVLSSSPGLVGTDVAINGRGPDASVPASLADLTGVPAEPFRIAGAVKVTDEGFQLSGIDAELGGIAVKADGRVGSQPDLHGTRLRFEATGPRLSELDWIVDQASFPQVPFSVSGGIGIGPDGYLLEGVVAELADHRVEADGRLVAAEDLIGTEVVFSIEGSDLGHAGRLVEEADLVELPALPEESYAISGDLRIDHSGYVLRTLDLTLGSAEGHISGTVGHLPGLQGTDLTVDGNGPNASLFTALTGISVPKAPFRLHGRFQRLEAGFRFHDFSAQLGEYHAAANGVLGELPNLVGTNVELHAEGPSLELLEQLADVPPLPNEPFAVDAHLEGDPRRFKSDQFAVRLGDNDVRGRIRLDLTDKPSLEAVLKSDRIDVTQYLERRAARKRALAVQQEQPPTEKRDRLIPDTPFDFDVLRDADADVLWTVADFLIPADRFNDVNIDLILEDGRLQLGPLSATGSLRGKLNTSLVLEPAGNGYSLTAELTLEGGRFDLSGGSQDPSQKPEMDVYLEYSGTGASPRELAASSNGFIGVILGEGVMEKSLVDLVAADILVTLIEALNPFSRTQETSLLECAVVLVPFDDGIATLEQLAVQNDRTTMLGGGQVDLNTEKLGLDWVTKPRRGLGLSASAIANPYIRLGGTLANPELALKPLEAAKSTGIAVATGGLSILGKGLWNRVSAERKVCDKATKKARKILDERGVKLRR